MGSVGRGGGVKGRAAQIRVEGVGVTLLTDEGLSHILTFVRMFLVGGVTQLVGCNLIVWLTVFPLSG